jgi:hypothetical protein
MDGLLARSSDTVGVSSPWERQRMAAGLSLIATATLGSQDKVTILALSNIFVFARAVIISQPAKPLVRVGFSAVWRVFGQIGNLALNSRPQAQGHAVRRFRTHGAVVMVTR